MNMTTRDWLEAALGALLYIQNENKVPPGLSLLMQGIRRELYGDADITKKSLSDE